MARYERNEKVIVELNQKIIMDQSERNNFRELMEQLQEFCDDNESCEKCPLAAFGMESKYGCCNLFEIMDEEIIQVE